MYGDNGDGYRPWKFHVALLVAVGLGILCYLDAKGPHDQGSGGGMPIWLMQHAFHH